MVAAFSWVQLCCQFLTVTQQLGPPNLTQLTWPFQHVSLCPSHISLLSWVQKMKKSNTQQPKKPNWTSRLPDFEPISLSLSLSLSLKWFGRSIFPPSYSPFYWEIIRSIRRTADVVFLDFITNKMLLFMQIWHHLVIFIFYSLY